MMALSRLSSKDKTYIGVAEQCTQCGKCSSGCPAARYLELRPRKIALMAQRDLVEQLLDSDVIWKCTQCHQCMERCPREITPYDIIIYLQNLAVLRGYDYPKDLNMLIASIKRYGAIQLPQEIFDREFENYERGDLNLPDLEGPADMEGFLKGLIKVLEESKP